ncbi:MAG: class I SAM-dependent methyltransferase [Roseicyclus sp.]|nr:class I SAM-dependent methyltransferase [Roseicyclus sp.]
MTLRGHTLSQEQRDYAVKRIMDACLRGGEEIKLQDYRDAQGTDDSITSIEIFEAVGEAYWPANLIRYGTASSLAGRLHRSSSRCRESGRVST